MPLRLKSLELHGYKTFAGKTNFEFAGGITAIVGPNGSGKSNIADAVRWVLGEQSYSLLRAKKTEDMIFSGSEQKPRAGMASAMVTFDNTDSWLPVDFSEVALARRAYRDGRNEYVLNGQQVRLKDINELLSKSGLSERTYTILGQGLVDASLALKADERRKLFEEAAGIGLYRSRREETLRRLETTQRNLDRVLDILAELEPRLKSLEKQARRAKEYSQVLADLRLLLRDWYGYHWHVAQKELAQAKEMAHTHDARVKEGKDTYQNVRQEFTSFRERLTGLRARLNSWHRQSAILHNTRETTSRELAVLEERRKALEESLQSAEKEKSSLGDELRIAINVLGETQKENTQLASELKEARTQVVAAQDALRKRQEDRAKSERLLKETNGRLDALSAQCTQLRVRMEELQRRIETENSKLEISGQVIERAEKETKQAEGEYKDAVKAREMADSARKKADNEVLLAQQHLAELEQKAKSQQAELTEKQANQVRLQAQLYVLEQAEQSLAGYADGAKLLLNAARKSKLTGLRGALSSTLDVPAEYETAIAAALGEQLDAVVLSAGMDVEQALALLESESSGRAALLPLDWLSPQEPIKAPRSPECIGVAADLVKVKGELQPAVDLLLGQVLVIKDRSSARKILAGQSSAVRVVTLKGEVFSAGGPIVAGKGSGAAALSRPRERREIQEKLTLIKEAINQAENELRKNQKKVEICQERIDEAEELAAEKRAQVEKALASERQSQTRSESAQRQLDWHIGQRQVLREEIIQYQNEKRADEETLSMANRDMEKLQEDVLEQTTALAGLSWDENLEEFNYWNTQAAVSEEALGNSRARLDDHTRLVERSKEQMVLLERRIAEITKSLVDVDKKKDDFHKQGSGVNTQLSELQALIDPAERELETAEAQEVDLQSRESAAQRNLSLIEHQYNQIQLDLGRKQEAVEGLRQKIEDDFGLVEFEYVGTMEGPVPLPFDGMVQQLPMLVELPPNLEENLTRQRGLLRRMGPVNPEAEQEYEAVRERHDFLTTQLHDLRSAEANLREVISELDEITRREFHKTFSAVAEEFHLIFHQLFGGGSARLVLTDPENLTETGIDIEARLPGKREQGLALLSGGERSLTAISLVFALLKVSPTPVCVMDEVDAMLDEANVARFRELLQELAKETQFVIITHNRNTVQAADIIYGVTMSRDSTSQVMSLRLDNISEEYLRSG